MARTRKPSTFPDVILPGDWQIEEWRPDGTGAPCPCTDTAGRRQWVPRGNSPFAKDVRFHENLHVKFSPEGGIPEGTGVSPESMFAAEDYRVNVLGQHIRPHDAAGHSPLVHDAFAIVTSFTERRMAQATAAMMGYTSSDGLIAKLQGELYDVSRMRVLPAWLRSHASSLAEVMETVSDNAGEYVEGAMRGLNVFQEAIDLGRWLDEFSDAEPKAPPVRANPEPDGDEEYDEEAEEEGGNSGDAVWGDMRIETPPLTERHKNAVGRRTSASAQGSRIRHPSRMVTGEIFGRTRKQATPDAVLVDDSGSMHWSEDKFYELVKQLPVGIVAAYSGESGTGVLRILAKDGRMVAPGLISTPYGGNEVDGPALRWLARQSGRKVWVSDQGVCSEGGNASDLKADCDEIVAAAGIRVCLTTDPAAIMRALRSK